MSAVSSSHASGVAQESLTWWSEACRFFRWQNRACVIRDFVDVHASHLPLIVKATLVSSQNDVKHGHDTINNNNNNIHTDMVSIGSCIVTYTLWRSVGGPAAPHLVQGSIGPPRGPPVFSKKLPYGPSLKQLCPSFFCHPTPLPIQTSRIIIIIYLI